MAFKYNGNSPKKITYKFNSINDNLKKLMYNATAVWSGLEPIYWFNRIVNSNGEEKQILTNGYQGNWTILETCCDDISYSNDIWHLQATCNSHTPRISGTASGSTGGHTYAEIYITEFKDNGLLKANDTAITTAGTHIINVSNTDTLHLEATIDRIMHINYIRFYS